MNAQNHMMAIMCILSTLGPNITWAATKDFRITQISYQQKGDKGHGRMEVQIPHSSKRGILNLQAECIFPGNPVLELPSRDFRVSPTGREVVMHFAGPWPVETFECKAIRSNDDGGVQNTVRKTWTPVPPGPSPYSQFLLGYFTFIAYLSWPAWFVGALVADATGSNHQIRDGGIGAFIVVSIGVIIYLLANPKIWDRKAASIGKKVRVEMGHSLISNRRNHPFDGEAVERMAVVYKY